MQCDICHKSYANIYILKSHIKAIHEKSSQYKCLYPGCDKEFKSLYRLYVHDLSHEGIKPFKCNICFRSFSEKGTLKTHKKKLIWIILYLLVIYAILNVLKVAIYAFIIKKCIISKSN